MSVLFMLLSSFTNLILLVFIRRCCLCSLYSSPYFLVIQRLTGNRENERMRIHEELRLGQFLYPSLPSPLDPRKRRPPWRVGQFSSVVTCRSRCTNVQPGRRLPYVFTLRLIKYRCSILACKASLGGFWCRWIFFTWCCVQSL